MRSATPRRAEATILQWRRGFGHLAITISMLVVVPLLTAASARADGNVNVTVTGSGVVTSTSVTTFEGAPIGGATATPGEIDCNQGGGSVCSANFVGIIAAVRVTLTATPAPGQVFLGWTEKDGTETERCTTPPSPNPTCQIELNGSPGPTSTVTAEFAPAFTLNVLKSGLGKGTVTSAPGGIACGPDCSETYLGGTEITLTAVAAVNSAFAGWSGGSCSGTGTCELTIGADVDVTANFHLSPIATTDGSGAGPAGHLASLQGHVNPNGVALSECRFLYGPTTAYGESTHCTQSASEIGSGIFDVAVTAITAPLEPETTYHFRLRASSPGGTAQGKDRTFTTGPAPVDGCPNAGTRVTQGIEVLLLPDCMALEQISPPKKGNQHARVPRAVSADGERVLFNSIATLGDCPNTNGIGGDLFVATRSAAGWKTECTNLPLSASIGGSDDPVSFTPDLSQWFQLFFISGEQMFVRRDLDRLVSPISPSLANLFGESGPSFLGASSDHSHLYFRTESNNPRSDTFLPGDPQPTGNGEDNNVYIAQLDSTSQPSLALLARDEVGSDAGKAWGANCGARLGGMEGLSGSNLNLQNGLARNQGAISTDGTRVYFSTRPDQPPTGSCNDANKKRIMVREETSAGPDIEELIVSECDRVAPECNKISGVPFDGDDVYQGTSVDQTRVYFNTTRQLADTDLDGGATSCKNSEPVAGCDLYLYDSTLPPGDRLIQISAGEPGATTPGIGASVQNSVTAISADGSHVYFVARSVLTSDQNPEGDVPQDAQNNLYLYRTTQSGGDLAFVGILDSDDDDGGTLFGGSSNWQNDAYAVPIVGSDAQGNEIGGDGHVLLFRSKAALTSDDSDSARDLFRYDAKAGTLERVSRAQPGGSDGGAFDVLLNPGAGGPAVGTSYGENRRWVSENGNTVLFKTAEDLIPGDVNEAVDVYLWRGGQVFRLPGSTDIDGARANELTLSHDGSTIAYHSSQQLVTSDGDGAQDVYVARVNGGFPSQPEPVCEGEACQGVPAAISGETGAATGSSPSAGNVKTQGKPKPCPNGKRKVRRGGKVRCVSKKGRQTKRNAHHSRDANANGRTGR